MFTNTLLGLRFALTLAVAWASTPAVFAQKPPDSRPEPSRTVHRSTHVSIVGDEFYVNGRPTYAGRFWMGKKIQGLLLNARLLSEITGSLP